MLELFRNPEELTIRRLSDASFRWNITFDQIFLWLDATPEFSGILREATTEFLETEIKGMIPESILSSDLFSSVVSGVAKELYEDDEEEAVRDSLVESFMIFDVFGADGRSLLLDECPQIGTAIIAYVELYLGNYIEAIGAAGFALGERDDPDFSDNFDNGKQESIDRLRRIMAGFIEIFLQKAMARHKGVTGVFFA
ncbi:MAG: hypothetical protein PHT88_00245 [Candidatus Moranbacteria bacterium]|nr:hypothetical protein [Candidatus Moranbacteria bacterium]